MPGAFVRRVATFALTALFVFSSACAGDGASDPNERLVLEHFRDEHGGWGRTEPWTAKEPVGIDGQWVVREFLDVSVKPMRSTKTIANEKPARVTYVVSYWSRIVEASAWRGPDLPTFWDRHSDGYIIVNEGSRATILPADRPAGP